MSESDGKRRRLKPLEAQKLRRARLEAIAEAERLLRAAREIRSETAEDTLFGAEVVLKERIDSILAAMIRDNEAGLVGLPLLDTRPRRPQTVIDDE